VRSGALIVSLGFLVLGAFVAPAEAQEAENDEVQQTAMARSLFAQGVELMAEERFEAAATHFQRSLELRQSPVVHYNLASALLHLERYVEAVEHLQRVLANDEAPTRAREAAQQLLTEAEPKVGFLTLDIDGDPTAIIITLDDRMVPNAAIGVAIPVDPGARTVIVRRGETIVAQGVVEVSEGRSAVLTLQVPLAPEPEPDPSTFAPGSTLLQDLPEGHPDEAAATVPDPAEVARLEQERQRREAERRRAEEPPPETSILKNPWFWTGVGAGVVAAVVIATVVALLVVSEPAQPIEGTLQPGVVELGR